MPQQREADDEPAPAGAGSDAELVARLAWRDEAALASLYDRYSALTFGLAARVCGSEARAEEIVQDTFMKLWRRPEAFDASRGALSTYLITLVRNAAIDAVRRERPSVPLEDEAGTPLPLASSRPGPLEAAELGQLGAAVRAGMAGLSEAHRRTVELAYFAGASREEIAAEMNVPVGTVKSRLKYALDKLRAVLEPGGPRPASRKERP